LTIQAWKATTESSVEGKHFKYISIDSGVYDVEDLTFPQALVSQLPLLPSGEWNLGHIAKGEDKISPCFAWTIQRTFSSIQHTWYPVFVDYLSLTMVKMLLPNVYEATAPGFDVPVIVKFARFPWEIDYYNQETQVYSWIKGHDIRPEFLGHVTEGERVIGFVLQKLHGCPAGHADLQLCRTVVSALHSLGIHHGDLNKHNFVVQPSRAYLIDFEVAKKIDDQQA
jgi:serine/threonine protein kinase